MTRHTRHPGFPLLMKRAEEKRQRRAAYLSSLRAQDSAIALGFFLIVAVLVLWSGK